MEEPTKEILTHTHMPSNKCEFGKNLKLFHQPRKPSLGGMGSLTEQRNTSSQADICVISVHSECTGVSMKAKLSEVEWGTESRAKIRRQGDLNMQELRPPMPVTLRH